MNDLPVLYSFRRCPYAIRARMAVAATGIEVTIREVLLKDKPPELIAASVKATVPVLVLPDGNVIDESLESLAQSAKTRRTVLFILVGPLCTPNCITVGARNPNEVIMEDKQLAR